MSDFKWKIASISNWDKKYNRVLIENLDKQLHILNEACRSGKVDSITVNYVGDVTIQYEIHRKDKYREACI